MSRHGGLAALIQAMEANQERTERPYPLPEAQVETLKEVCARYQAGCPFKVGDLVTPRKGHNIEGAGRPHIVVEIAAEPIRNFECPDPADIGVCTFGRRMDIRVIGYGDPDSIVPWWMESWCFEPYPT